jgi:hypothetical protein
LRQFSISIVKRFGSKTPSELTLRLCLYTNRLIISTTITVTAAATISNSDLAPVEVEITEAKKNPDKRLIIISDVRRQGFCDH